MFKIRTSAPDKWLKIWNNRSNGGLSWCINGYPTSGTSNVLANCVGYACSRFNEIYNELTGYDGLKYPELCCNAEDFWTAADRIGLKKGQTPKAGAIMCWEGIGSLAGHVAIVERVESDTEVFTSESGYGGPMFWNATRRKADGNWGAGGSYRFRGFIYNPAVKEYRWVHEWHLYEDGKEVTGWKKVNGEWYHMDSTGAMQTGWLKESGAWYYLTEYKDASHKEGQMWKGWLKYSDEWYFLSREKTSAFKEGQMVTGWLKDGSNWYYLGSDGAMLTGWRKIYWSGAEKWFYFIPESGRMVTGDYTINGKVYHFDQNGVWQG